MTVTFFVGIVINIYNNSQYPTYNFGPPRPTPPSPYFPLSSHLALGLFPAQAFLNKCKMPSFSNGTGFGYGALLAISAAFSMSSSLKPSCFRL